MRHGNKVNHLGRKTGHLKAMLSNMACSLLEHKRITTTLAKAKSLRVFVEPILTKSKNDTTHSRRLVFSHLQNKEVVTELFRDIALKIANRDGGYTRIIRTGFRLGDNAEMCIIEVDYNDIYTNEKAKKTKRRSRRGGGATTPSVSGETDVEDVVLDEVVAQETVAQDAIVEDVVSEEVVVEDTVTEEAVVEEAVAEEAVVEDAVSEEAVVEEVVTEEAVVEEVVAEEVVAEEVVAEEVVVEEVVVEEAVSEETVIEETTPETPAEDSTEEEKKEEN